MVLGTNGETIGIIFYGREGCCCCCCSLEGRFVDCRIAIELTSMNRYLFSAATGNSLTTSSFFDATTCVVRLMNTTTTPNRFPLLFQRTKLTHTHTARRSTPTHCGVTTFVSQTTTGSSSILFFRIIYTLRLALQELFIFVVFLLFRFKGTFSLSLACVNPLHLRLAYSASTSSSFRGNEVVITS